MDGKTSCNCEIFFITTSHAIKAGSSLRTADAFPVIASLPPKNSGGREAMTENASAVRRLGRAKLLCNVNMTNGLKNFLIIKMIITEKYACYTSSKVVVLAKLQY